MNSGNRANPYTSSASQGGNPRVTEGWALIEAARRMAESIVMPGDEADRKLAMKTATRLNWRLWTIFQAELTIDNGDIERDLRVNMLTLCKFVDSHTVDILAKPTAEKLATLININRNIAAGLMETADTADAVETDGGDKDTETPSDQPPQPLSSIDQKA